MTTHENFLNTVSENANLPKDAAVSQPSNPNDNSLATPVSKLKQTGTLRRRLLLTVLPTTLIPLIVASAIGSNLTRNRSEKEQLTNIREMTVLTSEIGGKFFKDALDIKYQLEANPFILQTVETSAQQVRDRGLAAKAIEQLEKEFAATKLVAPNPSLNNYLKALTNTQNIAEVILTEVNGLNVAYSAPSSDFVQRDEDWWQIGRKEGQKVLQSVFDDSTKTVVVETVSALKKPNSEEIFGVAKVSVETQGLSDILAASVGVEVSGSQVVQVIDAAEANILDTLTAEGSTKAETIVGGESVLEAAKIFTEAVLGGNLADLRSNLQKVKGISAIALQESDNPILSFESQGRYFKFTRIPDTNFLAAVSMEKAEIERAGNELMAVFASTGILLGILATILIVLVSRNLSKPLTNLAGKAQQVAAGDLQVTADLEGTDETRTLADNFNNLLKRVNALIGEQEALAAERLQQKETLEQEIYQLMDELQGAVDGDLTVRASLSSLEMSTVADLFNAIIDSLKDIAVQVKDSSTQVSTSLGTNERSIQLLADQAIAEAEETRKTLGSIQQMSDSIEEVAANANQAATLADGAYQETQEGSNAMDETVNSILNLRTTVGETAKKMKRLGESSQKISQVVSLIEEIALKTNLLAINASVEASRAGEQGQGFTVVAEQVGALAEQSAAATKEIAKIVAAIQAETQEVTQAMEVGTTQVVDTSRLVESTKERLGQVLERSRSINELMKLISQSTDSQKSTSRSVTDLMQQIAKQSEARLSSSQQIAQSMQTTAQVAKKLESAVEQFKVSE